MHFSLETSSHATWNHSRPDQAPQPQTPEASEVSRIQANLMLVPFQPSAKVFHQAIEREAIALRKKDLPGRITLQCPNQ